MNDRTPAVSLKFVNGSVQMFVEGKLHLEAPYKSGKITPTFNYGDGQIVCCKTNPRC